MPYNIAKEPIPLITGDHDDLVNHGLYNPTEEEVEEVVAHLRSHYQYDEEWAIRLKEAVSLVRNKRALF